MIRWINGLTIAGGLVYIAWISPFPLNLILLAGLAWFFTIDLRHWHGKDKD